jgi:hypothetical protein
VAGWHFCPAAGLFRLGTFWKEDATSGSREARNQRRDQQRCSVANRVALSGRKFGRASERYESKRPQWGEQEMARAVGPATGRVTICHGDHSRHGAGHDQGHGPRSRRSRRRSQPARCRSRPGSRPRSRRSRRRSRHLRRQSLRPRDGERPACPTFDGSPVRLPRRTRSLGSLRDASACNQLANDCKRQPLGSQGPIPANQPWCVQRWPGCRRPTASRTCSG